MGSNTSMRQGLAVQQWLTYISFVQQLDKLENLPGAMDTRDG